MKFVAFVGDSHFHQESRFDECVRIHAWIAEDIARRGVDLLVHTGDVFERKSTPAERNAVAEWLAACAETCPVLVVRGNHDPVGDLAIFSRLKSATGNGHEIVVEEGAGVHVLAGVAVAAVAWPRKAELLARMSDAGRAETEQTAGGVLEDLFRGLAMQLQHEAKPVDEFPRMPTVLAMHAMVRGSRTSAGQPLVGCDLEVGREQLALVGADFTALGHIHKAQEWDGFGGAPIVYTGSPRRTAFGETEAKGYVLATFGDDGSLVGWERVETPARAMVLIETKYGLLGDHVPGVVDFDVTPEQLDGIEGAEVRFRYTVSTEHRAAARIDAAESERVLLHAGAASVKVEEVVIATTRARTPEVTKAQSIADKVRVLWAAKGFAPATAQEERLMTKLVAVGG